MYSLTQHPSDIKISQGHQNWYKRGNNLTKIERPHLK